MPKVTEEYRSERRAAITAAAARCFARKGVHQSSMADIIAEAGLSAGAIYNHFKSKEEIIVSVATTLLRGRLLRMIDASEAAGELLSPADLIARGLGLLRDSTYDGEKPLGGLIIQFWAEAVANPTLLELMQEQMRSIRGELLAPTQQWAQDAHGLTPERAAAWAEQASQIFIAVIIGFIVQQVIFPDFDADNYIANARLAVGSITPPAV